MNKSQSFAYKMKQGVVLLAMMLACFCSALQVEAQTYNSTVDRIDAGYNYQEIDGIYSGLGESATITGWPDNRTMLVYGLRMPVGKLKAEIVFTPKTGQYAKFTVRILNTAKNKVVAENTVQSTSSSQVQQTLKILDNVQIDEDIFYRFEVVSPNGKEAISSVDRFNFYRTSTLPVVVGSSQMAPAAHLMSVVSTDPAAPRTRCYDWVYNETMIPTSSVKPSNYAMSIGESGDGSLEFYTGIQTTGNDMKGFEYPLLFSVWDKGDTDKDPNLPSYLRAGALDCGADVEVNRFGGEGTGTNTTIHNAKWRPGQWVKLIGNARPETVISTNSNGEKVVYNNTLVTFWYRTDDNGEWNYIATVRACNKSIEFENWYSFIENFNGHGGELSRRAYFRNGYKRFGGKGQWFNQNKIELFGHGPDGSQRNHRNDYGHGATSISDNAFYLQIGGFNGIRDSANTVPLKSPEFAENLNLRPLYDRMRKAYVAEGNSKYTTLAFDCSTLSELKAVVAEILEEENRLGGYMSKNLAQLKLVYANGTCTDLSALKEAVVKMASTSLPLKFGLLFTSNNISSDRYYIISLGDGNGCLSSNASSVGKEQTMNVAGLYLPDNATIANINWKLIPSSSDGYYNICNLVTGKYLSVSGGQLSQSNTPINFSMSFSGNNATITSAGYSFNVQIYDNYFVDPEAVDDFSEMEVEGNLFKTLSSDATKVKLSGPINGTDVYYLRKLCKERSLGSIDMSEAYIVGGGIPYAGVNIAMDDCLGKDMFRDLTRLSYFEIPYLATSTGAYTLSGSRVSYAEIPDHVVSVGGDTYSHNSSLTTATVGARVKSFGQGVFYNDPRLTNVFMKPKTPPTYSAYTFSSTPTIHVYKDSYQEYIDKGWHNRPSDFMGGTVVGDLDDYVKPATIVTDCSTLSGVAPTNAKTNTLTIDRYCILRNDTIVDRVTTSQRNYSYSLPAYRQNDYFQTMIKYTNLLTSEKSQIIYPVICPTTKSTVLSCDIDATMMEYIRKMVLEGQLEELDLSEANIVGGTSLYESGFATKDNEIPAELFYSASNAFGAKPKSVILPESLETIGTRAFSYCNGLSSIVIPDNVKTIGFDAFANCSNLREVTIGAGVEEFVQGAFWATPADVVYCRALVPPSLGAYPFADGNCSTREIHVYKEALQAYLDAGWHYDAESNPNGYGKLIGDLDKVFPVKPLLTLVEVVTNASDDVMSTTTDDMRGNKETLKDLKVIYYNKVKITYRVLNEGLPYKGNVGWAHYFKNDSGRGNWGGAGKTVDFPRNEIVEIVEECSGQPGSWAGSYINIKDESNVDMLESDVKLKIGDVITDNGVMVYLAGPQKADGIEFVSDNNNVTVTAMDAKTDNIDVPETVKFGATDLTVTSVKETALPTLKGNQLMFVPEPVYDNSSKLKTMDNVVKKTTDGLVCSSLLINDSAPFHSEYEFTADIAKYVRPFTGNWSTLCLPFTATVPSSYEAMEYDESQSLGSKLNFNSVNSLEAGKAYLVRKTGGASNMLTGTNTEVIISDPVPADVAVDFLGVFTHTQLFDAGSVDRNNYSYYGLVGSQQVFAKAGVEASCPPFRAYLRVEEGGSSSAPQAIEISFNGDVDGIDNIMTGDNDSEGVIHNLAGQRITKPVKGVYVKNGAKVVVR